MLYDVGSLVKCFVYELKFWLNMSVKTEKDKQKALQEKHQAILCELLKLEDNKYCVDCDAKGEFPPEAGVL